MSKIDVKGLTLLTREANALTSKPAMTKQEEKRFAYLLSAIAAIKAGATLAELDEQDANEQFRAAGLPTVHVNREDRSEMRAKAAFVASLLTRGGTKGAEFRGETEGALSSQLGTYTSLGYLVPTEFYQGVFDTLLEHDALFDEDVVTRIDSTNGRLLNIPVWDDAANEGAIVGEGATDTTQYNLGNPGHVTLAAYSFRTPVHPASIEVLQDVETLGGFYNIFQRFASDRLARAIGKYLVTGSGSNQPTGLLTAMAAANCPTTIASGSSGNSGGAETGTNSIGSADLAKCYYNVNERWRNSSKCGWLMNDTVLSQLMQIVTKQGLPLVDLSTGIPKILNKPVHVSPSMSSNGSGNVPVIFGDLSQFYVRIISDEMTRIQVLKEAPGLIEQGNVGLRMFLRADGRLAYVGDGSGTGSPVASITNHS